jgi:methylated-DNA-protein-cysteine methyltransferase related protein
VERPSVRAYSPLYRRIWETIQRIPRGRVATYGQIAALAGHPGQPRLVGYALHRLPAGVKAPWHRVINAKGEISARAVAIVGGEESLQQKLLEEEGIVFIAPGRLDLACYQWRPRRR